MIGSIGATPLLPVNFFPISLKALGCGGREGSKCAWHMPSVCMTYASCLHDIHFLFGTYLECVGESGYRDKRLCHPSLRTPPLEDSFLLVGVGGLVSKRCRICTHGKKTQARQTGSSYFLSMLASGLELLPQVIITDLHSASPILTTPL